MRTFFDPQGIVVIGVSPSAANLAQRVLHNLKSWSFPGKLVAVGRRAGDVCGVPIVTDMGDASAFEGCDLAVILTPAPTVPDMIRRCGALGITRAIIETSGFTELGDERADLEQDLATAAREAGVRFIGPNCVGVLQLDRGNVNAFAIVEPREVRSDAAVVSQSGGVGLCVMRALAAQGVVTNWMASIGNKLDVDEVEIVTYLLDHEPVRRMLCYLESMPRGRDLCDALRGRDVPVVVHKVNRTEQSSRVAQSHTAALSNDDAVVSASLEQAGVIRAADTREAALAMAATRLPPVNGDRVALLSRSGGHAVIATDACAAEGLTLPPFSRALREDLERLQPSSVIERDNPLDFGDVFDFALMGRILERVCREDGFDAVVFVLVFNPAAEIEPAKELIAEVGRIARRSEKPVSIAAVVEEEQMRPLRALADWPIAATPEEAVHSIGLLWRREQARRRAQGPAVAPPTTTPRPLGERARVLSLSASFALLEDAGVPVAPLRRLGDPFEPGRSFVAKLSASSDEVVHKAAAGLVVVGLDDETAVSRAASALERRAAELSLDGAEVVLQPRLSGVELFLGARRDPSFGPVVLFGAGGSLVELVDDVVVWPYPFTVEEIANLWGQVRASRLVGDRLDPLTLARWLAGLGALLEHHRDIESVDVNPVIVGEAGASAVDARVVIGRPCSPT